MFLFSPTCRRRPGRLAALWLCLGAALAQEAKPPGAGSPEILTSVAALRQMGAARAEAEAVPVRVRGVVTFVASKKDAFKIQDDSGGIGVALPAGTPCPAEGDLVEVDGRSSSINVQTHRYPHLAAERVAITGRGDFPEPVMVGVAELASFKHYNQWVSVEGVVVMWKRSPASLSLMLTGPDTWAVVHVRGWKKEDFPRDWHGARLRVTGVNMGISHSPADTLIAPGPEQVTVLQAGAADLFTAPEVSFAAVRENNVPAAERARVTGVVTAVTDSRTVYLQKGEEALCVQLQHGWLRAAGEGHLYADAGPLPDLKPGDVIEAVGSRRSAGTDPWEEGCALVQCHVRVSGSAEVPPPLPVSLAEIAGGAHTWRLAQTGGRLLQTGSLPLSGGRWRSTLLLEQDGARLSAALVSRVREPFRQLAPNDEVMLTGVIDPATSHRPLQLRLTGAGDVASLGLSPAVRRRQLWLWGGATGALLLLGGVWIATLHRSLRRQSAAEAVAHELNVKLEKRVAKRTEELEKTQAELRRALDQERELGELKSRFVTMVSHEFRTPLGIIMSAIELLRHYEDKLPPEQKQELQNDIHGSTKLMAGLMEQVLVLGRVEAGKLGCRPVDTDLDLLAGKLTDECLSATGQRCPVLWEPSGDLSGARADESLLRHIFSNLISNAVKYSPAGTPVRFRARREGADAVFEIQDQGIGIPAEDMPKLFEAFSRCGNVGEVPGTGLGLVIVKRCVELHGGRLDIDSKPGEGSTFTVRLPLF